MILQSLNQAFFVFDGLKQKLMKIRCTMIFQFQPFILEKLYFCQEFIIFFSLIHVLYWFQRGSLGLTKYTELFLRHQPTSWSPVAVNKKLVDISQKATRYNKSVIVVLPSFILKMALKILLALNYTKKCLLSFN